MYGCFELGVKVRKCRKTRKQPLGCTFNHNTMLIMVCDSKKSDAVKLQHISHNIYYYISVAAEKDIFCSNR